MIPILAALPILVVIILMVVLHWNGQRAGPAGWAVGLLVSFLYFGMTPQVLWISQLKGLYLSLFVLAILWPALWLYRIVQKAGGIQAIAESLGSKIHDQQLLIIGLAWAFSGMLEGLAGFGLPIAVVSPMLVGLGISPVLAVTITAIGHAWSVTFGDMGVIFQTLVTITGYDPASLVTPAAFFLGIACLACGWGVLLTLGYWRSWRVVTLIGLIMAGTQYGLARLGLLPLSAFGAGMAGMAGFILIRRSPSGQRGYPRELKAAIASYGSLALLMAVIFIVPPVNNILKQFVISFNFPAVVTLQGYSTPTNIQVLRLFTHPGLALTLVALCSFFIYRRLNLLPEKTGQQIARDTWQSAAPTSLGIISMVGLSSLMEHSGMMYVLAKTISEIAGSAFPLFSPLIGILGAFATGSNNNSNVMFAPLQQQAAIFLHINPGLLLATQTAGGALGSMLAPAKILVGCSTVGLKEGQGDVLRRTLGYGLGFGLLLGIIAWLAGTLNLF